MAIINPKAGTYDQKLVELCINVLRAKFTVNVVYPININEAKKLANSRDYDALIIGGGDSTIGSLSINVKIPIIILPIGRGNTFYYTVYGKIDPLNLFTSLIKCNRVEYVDIGFIREVNRGFVLGTSIGILADLVKLSELYKKFGKGMWSYTLASIDLRIRMRKGQIKPIRVSLRVNKEKVYDDYAYLLSIGNTPVRGRGSMKLFPKASISDGTLDVIVLPRVNDEIMDSLAKGSYSNVLYYKGKNIEITSDRRLSLEVDGDYILLEENKITVDVIPSSLPLLKPCT
ncbi:diacylglycerol/lipid kinase family protein [Saccharolobus caldissimus]|uniref:diacylglycerol/lipid kinase family protein n=1 Tax=Saccharolobus caldissimus TaxID=1702097 RepID=UPI001E4B4C54|nr:diacylglycerol kinase family protein [Saccharolobus caldissimus]